MGNRAEKFTRALPSHSAAGLIVFTGNYRFLGEKAAAYAAA
jgi:hypothetical protein